MSSLQELRDAAKAFDHNLPRGDAEWTAATEAALYEAVTRDLPSAPGHVLAGPLAALTSDATADLLRRLVADRLRTLGTAGVTQDDEVRDWPFDPETGAPGTVAPVIGPKLTEALVRAGRGEKVHPLCAILPDGSRCDCPEHKPSCTGMRARAKDWRKRATTDPVTLFAWWTRWPDANVGSAGNARPPATPRPQRDEAVRFLMTLLDEGHYYPAVQVIRKAADCGISESTLQRAAKELGVAKRLEIGGGFQYWEWYWPDDAQRRWMDKGLEHVDLMAQYLAEPKD